MPLRCLPSASPMLQKLQLWLRIRSPWLPTPRYSVTTKRNTSTNLFKPLPSPKNPIFDQKVKKKHENQKKCKISPIFSYFPVWGLTLGSFVIRSVRYCSCLAFVNRQHAFCMHAVLARMYTLFLLRPWKNNWIRERHGK